MIRVWNVTFLTMTSCESRRAGTFIRCYACPTISTPFFTKCWKMKTFLLHIHTIFLCTCETILEKTNSLFWNSSIPFVKNQTDHITARGEKLNASRQNDNKNIIITWCGNSRNNTELFNGIEPSRYQEDIYLQLGSVSNLQGGG